LIEETLTIQRRTRAIRVYRFVLGMVLALYVEFSRLPHLHFVERADVDGDFEGAAVY